MAEDEDEAAPRTPRARPAGSVAAAPMRRVHVSLFGALGVLCRERPLRIEVAAGATVAEVIEVLGRKLGSAFLDGVMQTTAEKWRGCRIFVNGAQVELETPLPDGNTTPEIELILLTAFEGG